MAELTATPLFLVGGLRAKELFICSVAPYIRSAPKINQNRACARRRVRARQEHGKNAREKNAIKSFSAASVVGLINDPTGKFAWAAFALTVAFLFQAGFTIALRIKKKDTPSRA
jgi:hypothetical protein